MINKKTLIAIVFLQFGILIGITMESNIKAVQEVPVSIRASLAQVFEDHVNTMNDKVKQIIENQNKLIDNETADSSIYNKSDTSGLTKIKIVDEK